MLVNEQRKLDSCFITECARVSLITQAHRGQICSGISEGIFFLAQLRDMLAAEDSTIVTEEHQGYGRIPPQRTKLYLPVVNIRQNDACEPAAVRGIHGHIFYSYSNKGVSQMARMMAVETMRCTTESQQHADGARFEVAISETRS